MLMARQFWIKSKSKDRYRIRIEFKLQSATYNIKNSNPDGGASPKKVPIFIGAEKFPSRSVREKKNDN